jgi:hypothetical protein
VYKKHFKDHYPTDVYLPEPKVLDSKDLKIFPKKFLTNFSREHYHHWSEYYHPREDGLTRYIYGNYITPFTGKNLVRVSLKIIGIYSCQLCQLANDCEQAVLFGELPKKRQRCS